MPDLILAPGREKSLLRRHPWVFSGAIAEVHGSPESGATVALRDNRGGFLAWAAYSPQSQIRARVWSWDEGEQVDDAFLRRRLEQALARRKQFFKDSDAARLVHGESDGIPGFILDRYQEFLVMQCLAAGAERWRMVLAEQALALSGARGVYERSDVDVRHLEGLPDRSGPVLGAAPAGPITICENGLLFGVDVTQGHKTGFYLDQRVNRQQVRQLAADREVLDCFCYTGGFTVNAVHGGARAVMAVDASAGALLQGQANLALNGLGEKAVEWLEGDVFQVLRKLRDRGRSFDLIVLDPPKFAQTAAQAERAARGYKDINLLACKLLRPGGYLVTFSCSGGISDELFQKIVAGAALDAGVEAQIQGRLHQGPDHPVALNFPEGAYLKGLVLRIVG